MGRGYGGVGRGRLYTYRYTVTTRMTSALRWAAMRAILMFHNCEVQSHKTVSTDHNFWSERRTEADSNRGPSAYQPTTLPLGQTGSLALRTCGSRLLTGVYCGGKQLVLIQEQTLWNQGEFVGLDCIVLGDTEDHKVMVFDLYCCCKQFEQHISLT